MLSPSGDLSQGVIAFALSQTAFPNAGTTENPKHIYADGTLVDIYAATAEALMKWEDRLLVSAVDITSAQLGQITLKITGKYVLDGKTVQLDGIVVSS